LSRRPNIPISTDRRRLQYQPMLETIVETVWSMIVMILMEQIKK
jgi:hypothetical protein